MAMTDDLKTLCEDIVNAYDYRIILIREIKDEGRMRSKELSKLIKNFAIEKRYWAKGHEGRKTEASILLPQCRREKKEQPREVAGKVREEHTKRVAGVSDMLKDFQLKRIKASAALKELVTKMAAKRDRRGHQKSHHSIKKRSDDFGKYL